MITERDHARDHAFIFTGVNMVKYSLSKSYNLANCFGILSKLVELLKAKLDIMDDKIKF